MVFFFNFVDLPWKVMALHSNNIAQLRNNSMLFEDSLELSDMRTRTVSVIQYEDEEPAKVEEVNIFIIVCVINSTNFVSSFPFNKFF